MTVDIFALAQWLAIPLIGAVFWYLNSRFIRIEADAYRRDDRFDVLKDELHKQYVTRAEFGSTVSKLEERMVRIEGKLDLILIRVAEAAADKAGDR